MAMTDKIENKKITNHSYTQKNQLNISLDQKYKVGSKTVAMGLMGLKSRPGSEVE